MSGRESLITLLAIAAAWLMVQVMIAVRAWRAHVRQARADEQVHLEALQRRGWRTLQRRKELPEDLQ